MKKHNRITNTDEILDDIYQELVSIGDMLRGDREAKPAPKPEKTELRGRPEPPAKSQNKKKRR